MAMCATVISLPVPQESEDELSSGNFTTQHCPGTRLRWHCSNPNARFDVKEDISWGSDTTHYTKLRDGQITTPLHLRDLYIANPFGASSNFTVEVEGID
jgi:hypothetical protein